MKIQKFNNISESLSDKIEDFIIKFEEDIEFGVFDWIKNVSIHTKIPEFGYCDDLSFISEKKIKTAYKYISLDKKIDYLYDKIQNIEEEINILTEEKDKIETKASSDLLYKFQEELLEKDSDSFYYLFIKEYIESKNNDKLVNTGIHPNILRKYKNNIILKLNSIKYNI